LCDNNLKSHLLVNASYPSVEESWDFVEKGKIILNISSGALSIFVADNTGLYISARFAVQPMNIAVMVNAVMAVFARENGEVMVFEPVPPLPEDPDPQGPEPTKGPALRVVK